MRRVARALSLVALLTWPGPGHCSPPGADPLHLKEVRALQQLVEQAIAQAEPSIACILVSRSQTYARWGQGPSSETPGKLGRFETARPLHTLDWRGQEADTEKRAIEDHDLSRPDAVPESYGSGVVLSAEGLVLTCAHVVRNATKIYVRLPGNRGSWADIHASDPRSDLAVLRLLDRVPDLRPLKMGDGSRLRKGQFVLCLANPFAAGFRDGSPSASWGLVSNLRRRAPGNPSEMQRSRLTLHHYGTLIQTDVRLNVGCSGGALLNLDGELVGLTTALAALTGSETPGGYAIPLDAGMRRVIEVLLRGEEVEYGFLGVSLVPGPRRGRGVEVYSVAPGSPASRVGLERGFFIRAINGQPVQDSDDLFLLIGMHLAGSTVRIEAARTPDGPGDIYSPRLAKFYVPGPILASHRPPARGGLRVDYTSILLQRVPLSPWGRALPEGVLIREVVPNSPADRAQLQVDKIITKVNNTRVTTPAEFYREMSKAAGSVELTVSNSEGRDERVTLDLK